jgi:hypothetical protein
MNIRAVVVARVVAAAMLATSAYIHAELYLNHGYRYIHVIGPAFLLQASAGFAVALLLLVTGSPVIRLLAIGVAFGALGGFVMSRTVGVAGFTERGFTPSPEAVISVAVELSAIAVLVAVQIVVMRAHRCSNRAHDGWFAAAFATMPASHRSDHQVQA